MAESWVEEETRGLSMGDTRLDARLRGTLSRLGERPSAGIPEACGGHAEMTGAYRMFDNPKAGFEAVLDPHRAATRRRVAAEPLVLLVQDTTEVDLTRPRAQVRGAGPLDGGPRRGQFLHGLVAFTPDGVPLGTVEATRWTRGEEPRCSRLSRAERAAVPFEKKESRRWLETLRAAQALAPLCPETRLICLCDSEGDIYEVLAEPPKIGWIIRACQDRALVPDGDGGPSDLRARLLAQPAIRSATVRVRGRDPKIACDRRGRRQARRSRKARVEVRSASVTLRPPWRPGRALPPVSVNAVLVTETDPPEGEPPVEWLLLTSLPVASAAEAAEVVRLYGVRWGIEVFFRVLKSGCRIEERRFEDIRRLDVALAVYLIVAWRTLYVCRLARTCPDLGCDAVFEAAEWRAVWKVVEGSDPPSRPPPLGEFIVLVARLGGYVARSGSPPGPQTVWIGMQRACDFAQCWNAFGPGAEDV